MPPQRLHVIQTGQGRPVVLVHGFTQTGASWQPVADDLVRDGYQVIAVDAPGHGGSAGIQAGFDRTADLLADAATDAATATITATQTGASFAGYSMGGRLCLHLALTYPTRVTRLVLIGATAGIEDPAERASRRASDEALADELERGGDQALPEFIDRWLANPLFAGLSPEAAGRTARRRGWPAGLAQSLRMAGTGAMPSLWLRLAELQMPVLVLAGERDLKFTEAGRRMVDVIGANARLRVISGAGHAAHLERPAEVATAMSEFLASTA